MHRVPGYTISEILVQTAHATILRGHRDQRPVLLRLPTTDPPTALDLARLRHDFAIARELDLHGVLKALAIEEHPGTLAVVMEDFAGCTLRQRLASAESELADALAFGIEIAKALGEIHDSGVVHKSIEPSNIFVHADLMHVKLSHFDIASRLPREMPAQASLNRLEGNLAYIAPEQTGRMNRAVDYRADFYSLGVILYEMFTGRLPFRAAEPRMLIRSHTCTMPEPPDRIRRTIPRSVSQIVMKLLAKDADDRYQSAAGIAGDLVDCLEHSRTIVTLRDFIPGAHDFPIAVQVPQALYDRELEQTALLEAFARVGHGATELVLLSGGAGSGKSALARAIYASVADKQGYYAAGRFDEHPVYPYAAFVQAFDGLIRDIMQQGNEKIAALRDRLVSALGSSRRMITDLVPAAAQLLGIEPEEPETQRPVPVARMHLAFRRFARAFAHPEHPLALLLDDMQWADPASLSLLQSILQHADTGYLLVIAAYRDSDLEPAHPLHAALPHLRDACPIYREIRLQSLSLPAVRTWVADALHTGEARLEPLTMLLHDTTGGNPLFLSHLWSDLASRNLFVLKRHSGVWKWNMEGITERTRAGGTAELLAEKLLRLAPETQRVLHLAACLGCRFDLGTLSIVNDKPPHETAIDLWEALREGLVLPLSDDYRFASDSHAAQPDNPEAPACLPVSYMFAHDAIRKTAGAFAGDSLHLEVARRLRQAHPQAPAPGLELFLIAACMRRATAATDDLHEREDFARWSFTAGIRAKQFGAHDTAIVYLDAASELLGDPARWNDTHDLRFALSVETAECEFLRGRHDRAGDQVRLLLALARSDLERIQAYDMQIAHDTAAGRYHDALAAGRAALGLVGMDGLLDDSRPGAAVDEAHADVANHLTGRTIQCLIHAPRMTDPGYRAALSILTGLFEAAKKTSPTLLYILAVAKHVGISLQHGHSELSPHGYSAYGAILTALGRTEEGFEFGKLGLDLNGRSGDVRAKCTLNVIFGELSRFVKPFRWALSYLEEGLMAGVESGDIACASHAAAQILITKAHAGDHLELLQAESDKLLALVHTKTSAAAVALLKIGRQRAKNLMGRTGGRNSLSDDTFDEPSFVAALKSPDMVLAAGYYYTVKLELAFLYGDYPCALAMAAEAEERLPYCAGESFVTDLIFFKCLTLAMLSAAAPPDRREEYLTAMRSRCNELTEWANQCPTSYRHKELLVAAEIARASGEWVRALDLYDRAIDTAVDNHFAHHEALGNELCAKAYLTEGREKPAHIYLIDALEGYSGWGATAKADQLAARYPDLIYPAGAESHGTDKPVSSQPSSPRRMSVRPPGGFAPMTSVIYASHVLSSQIVLSDLLPKLVATLMEHSGAQRGLLWLPGDFPLVVEAAPSQDTTPTTAAATSFESRTDIPHAVFRVVERTLQSVVLADAAGAGPFQSDRYIARCRPKSVLCMPILCQEKLIGIVYLENNLHMNAFTAEKCEALALLCVQAGISIENARLYEACGTRMKERTEELSETALRLKEAQKRLLMQERLASLGAIASGIAHEIKNPLNFVTNFAELSVNVAADLSAEIDEQHARLDPKTLGAIQEMIADLQQNSAKIQEHGKRADGIVKAMLEHARTGSEGEKRDCDVDALIREYVTLAYQGIRAQNPSFRVAVETICQESLPPVRIVKQDIGRVILNLIQNACYAVDAKKRAAGPSFAPAIKVSASRIGDDIEIRVRDNGGGIPKAVQEKIFQQFFTTKPPGEGTGLGLSISHDIVVEHGGTLRFETEEGQSTEFIVTLPIWTEPLRTSS